MRVCLMIEGQQGVTWDQWVSLALACEEHGFDGLFRSDHYLSFNRPGQDGALDAWATLAALAPQTQRIRLGTMVSPVTFRHPSELAKVVVVADYASDGRVELGMGAGWFEGEHRAYGFPFPPTAERFEMFEEQVEIVHRLWDRDEPEVSFTGKHYQLEGGPGLPKPLQDPHPPLILGGSAGPRAAALAARWADGYNMNFEDPGACAQGRERLSAACESIGRDPAQLRLSLMTNTIVGTDEPDLLDRTSRLMRDQGQEGDPRAHLESLGPERIWGTPDRVLTKLEQFGKAGVERVMLQHLQHDDLEAVALIGSEIIPEAASL